MTISIILGIHTGGIILQARRYEITLTNYTHTYTLVDVVTLKTQEML